MHKFSAVVLLLSASSSVFAVGDLPQLGPAAIAAAAPKLGALPGATVALPPLTVATPGVGKPWAKVLSVPLPGLGAATVSDTNTGRGGSHSLKVQVRPN